VTAQAARHAAGLLRLPHLFQDGRIFERGDILSDLLALGQYTQQAPHDLARARLRQVVAETDLLRLGNRADLLADPVAQIDSPVVSSGLPTTAASATSGLVTSADSISIVPMRWPDTFSTSSMRPVIVK